MNSVFGIVKLIIKIIAIPFLCTTKLLELFGLFILTFSSVVFNLFAGIFFFVSVIGFFMGEFSGKETWEFLIAGFMIFLIPMIGGAVVGVLSCVNSGILDFIKS